MEGCWWMYWLGAILGLFVFYKLLDKLLRLPTVGRYSERYIVVTGCDTGFGHEIARRLDSIGCHVFAGCLTEKGEIGLRKVCPDRLLTVSMDVSSPDSVRRALDYVKSKLPDGKGLWGLLNNAGILGRCGPNEWLTIDDYRQVNDVNLFGLIDVTMTFLPLIKKCHGRVVNTSSVIGRHSLNGAAPYSVSKYGVEAFTDGLRRSLRPFGCQAILIEPGFHPTQIISSQHVNERLEAAWNQASPEVREEFGEEYFRQGLTSFSHSYLPVTSGGLSDVIDAYEHALLGLIPRARYVVGYDARFFWLTMQALPEWLGDWLLHVLDFRRPTPAALKKRR